jgi:hypothetical protein
MELFKEDILADTQKARPRVFTFFLYGSQKVISCLVIEPVRYFELLASDIQNTNMRIKRYWPLSELYLGL